MIPAANRSRGRVRKVVARFLRRFRNESGAVAIWFAVLALPLAVLSFGLIDVNRAGVEKRLLQDALDAATLLAARSNADTDEELQAIGAAALAAQLTGMSDATLTSSSFKLVGTSVVGTATASIDPVIAGLWLDGDMNVGANAEVVRSSTNLEVALVLDITGSMSGQPLTDLKAAAKDLVDLVVQDVQTPYYTKVALAPYAAGVNVGGYAAGARGAVVGTRSITNIAWQTGSSKAVSGIARGTTTTVTASSHGFNTGDVIYFTGVAGTTQINNKYFTITRVDANRFRLNGTNSSGWSAYVSGGLARKCLTAACRLVVTAASHGYADGDEIYFTGVGGVTALNGQTLAIDSLTSSTFALEGTLGPTLPIWTSGGTAYCTVYGCEYFRFTNASSGSAATRMFQISTCVSERTGSEAYTDTAPSAAPVGANYPSTNNPCPTATITPLSTDKAALKSKIDSFAAQGSTAGQIGTAWGWYLVSPEFAYLWPSGSQGAAYGTPELLKVVVLMTDGVFNTAYCDGVIAKNSGSGSGSATDKIACPATNGDSTDQAAALCTAMKAKGIVIYTVGFNITNGSDAKTLMEACASDSDHVYLPSSGAALKDAFAAIGRDITKLRLSK